MNYVERNLRNQAMIIRALITPENRKYSLFMIEFLTAAANEIRALEANYGRT